MVYLSALGAYKNEYGTFESDWVTEVQCEYNYKCMLSVLGLFYNNFRK